MMKTKQLTSGLTKAKVNGTYIIDGSGFCSILTKLMSYGNPIVDLKHNSQLCRSTLNLSLAVSHANLNIKHDFLFWISMENDNRVIVLFWWRWWSRLLTLMPFGEGMRAFRSHDGKGLCRVLSMIFCSFELIYFLFRRLKCLSKRFVLFLKIFFDFCFKKSPLKTTKRAPLFWRALNAITWNSMFSNGHIKLLHFQSAVREHHIVVSLTCAAI